MKAKANQESAGNRFLDAVTRHRFALSLVFGVLWMPGVVTQKHTVSPILWSAAYAVLTLHLFARSRPPLVLALLTALGFVFLSLGFILAFGTKGSHGFGIYFGIGFVLWNAPLYPS